jgi:hypothetical protein
VAYLACYVTPTGIPSNRWPAATLEDLTASLTVAHQL